MIVNKNTITNTELRMQITNYDNNYKF